MPSLPALESDGFYHPSTEEQIQCLVMHAGDTRRKLRVRGSMHSPEDSILARDHPHDINVKLDRYRQVTIDSSCIPATVTAQAGCHLGVDPEDHTRWEDSLVHQLHEAGLSLPDFGGITHQTISGFLSTGSSGSTTHHSNYAHLQSLRIVDGHGNVQQLSRNDADPSNFFAAGVSAGLMGVVSTVTFHAVPSYHVRGTEETKRIEDLEFDLFGGGQFGKPSLEQFLRDNEFVRLLWWPLGDPPRVVVWKAHTMTEDDYDCETGPPENFKPNPYEAFPSLPQVSQRFVAGLQRVITRRWPPGPRRAARLNQFLPHVINRFVPLDRGMQKFWHESWKLLPMDNQIDENLIPLEFTEMKIPITETTDVMRKLRSHYERFGVLAAGTFGLEIYACKGSDFWLNPAFGDDAFLKVDVIWFETPRSNPEEAYYPQFWNLLSSFGFRLHWGKHLPAPSKAWRHYIRSQFAHWDRWKEIRDHMDPHRIFVTDYWQQRLGI